MTNNPEITYFDHYVRFNDVSPVGRRFNWPYLRNAFGVALPPNRDARILDFGCGAGLLLEWLSSEKYTAAEGVDCDPGQIAFARSLGVTAYLASNTIEWLRDAGLFDLIIVSDVLEHIPRGTDMSLLSAVNNALSPGGKAVLKVPNANAAFAARSRYVDATHERSYTETSLRQDLEGCGFRDVQIFPDDLWWPRSIRESIALAIRFMFRNVRRLEAMAEFGLCAWHIPLSANLVAVCEKI